MSIQDIVEKSKHCIVGSEGDAGGIVKQTLLGLGVCEIISIDTKLGNDSLCSALPPDSFLYIETPPKNHIALIQLGKGLGLHIFVEKPLVYSLDEVTEELPQLFCNFNMESIVPPGAVSLIRYCKGSKPQYTTPGDRGVILDLVTHLLSVFSVEELRTLSISEVFVKEDNGTDVFAKVFFNSGLQLEAGYGIENFIYAEYPDGHRITHSWLPVESWRDGILRFWSGECNLEKALLVSGLIDAIYRRVFDQAS